MDDLFDILVALFFIGLGIYLIVEAVKFIYKVLLLLFGSIIVIAEKVFATWTFLPPFLSWAVVGFIAVTLLNFAIIESHKLSRPAVKPVLIVLTVLFVFLPAFF